MGKGTRKERCSIFLEKPGLLQVQHLSLMSLIGLSVLQDFREKTYRLSFLHLSEAFIELQLQGTYLCPVSLEKKHIGFHFSTYQRLSLNYNYKEHTSALAVE